jgi:RHS repeat-associated protein
LTRSDDNQHTTTTAYDADDRLTSKTDPLGRVWTYEYDPNGNKTKVTDANGNATGNPSDGITTYAYDAVNRLSGIDYSDSTPDVTYVYDLAGRKTSMTDTAGTVGYAYDDSDRLISVTRSSGGFTYGYDTAGRLNARTYPDGTVTSYAYDDDSRLAAVTAGTDTTGYSYDAAGRLTATAYPNGWTEQRSYDNADRLSDIRSVNGANTLAVATYTRDNAGNPTQIVRDGVTETYAYDTADRITGACYGGQLASCAAGSKITYSYDRVGNRTSQTKFGTTRTYAYDNADELTSTTTGGNTTTYSYDADGQQTGQGTKTFTYDLAGRLTQVADGATTLASYTYDGDGNRLTKTASSTTTTYWWDENNDLPQLAVEMQGATVLRSYQYGSGLISMTSGGSAYYFHHDALGTISAVTKGSGAIEWTYTYTPYGEARQTTKVDPSAPDNPIQYTGELIDPETGFYDLRARVFSPSEGRFLTVDPAPDEPGDSELGDYLYANDMPFVLSDPSGARPVGDDEPGSQPGHPCPDGSWRFDPCPTPAAPTDSGQPQDNSVPTHPGDKPPDSPPPRDPLPLRASCGGPRCDAVAGPPEKEEVDPAGADGKYTADQFYGKSAKEKARMAAFNELINILQNPEIEFKQNAGKVLWDLVNFAKKAGWDIDFIGKAYTSPPNVGFRPVRFTKPGTQGSVFIEMRATSENYAGGKQGKYAPTKPGQFYLKANRPDPFSGGAETKPERVGLRGTPPFNPPWLRATK